MPFLHDEVALYELELSPGGILNRQPRGKDARQTCAEKRAVQHSKNANRGGKNQRGSCRAAQHLKPNDLLRAQRRRRFLGPAKGDLAKSFGCPVSRLGRSELNRRHQQALEFAMMFLDLQRGAYGVEQTDVAPPRSPRLAQRNAQQDHEDRDPPRRRQMRQPVNRHSDKKHRNPPPAEREDACADVAPLGATPHGFDA